MPAPAVGILPTAGASITQRLCFAVHGEPGQSVFICTDIPNAAVLQQLLLLRHCHTPGRALHEEVLHANARLKMVRLPVGLHHRRRALRPPVA